jgi:hypothetical protein
LTQLIEENPQESRREWMLWMFERAGKKNSNVTKRQFWQQNNHPIEIYSLSVFEQKLNYIHNNPVEAGFVTNPPAGASVSVSLVRASRSYPISK